MGENQSECENNLGYYINIYNPSIIWSDDALYQRLSAVGFDIRRLILFRRKKNQETSKHSS